MDQILSSIEKCFYQGVVNDFRKYIMNLKGCKKWMIHSDYCIGNEDKPNDVAVFSILPHLTTYEDMRQFIAQNFPKDIKNLSKIKENSLDILNSKFIFHFCYLFEKKRVLFSSANNKNEKEITKQAVIEVKKILNSWQIGEKAKKYYDDTDIKLKLLLTEMDRSSFNMKLFKDTIIVSLLSAFIAHLLKKEANAELVGWFSDRDDMTSYLDGILYDLFFLNQQGLSKRDSIDKKRCEILIGISNQKENSNWFDQLNRIPDYLAGTFADLNLEDGSVSKTKFNQILSRMIDNSNYGIFKCLFNIEGCGCSELYLCNK